MDDNNKRFIHHEPNPIAWLIRNNRKKKPRNFQLLTENPGTPWSWIKKIYESTLGVNAFSGLWGKNQNLPLEFVLKELVEHPDVWDIKEVSRNPIIPFSFIKEDLEKPEHFRLINTKTVYENPNVPWSYIKSYLDSQPKDEMSNPRSFEIECLSNPNTPWDYIKSVIEKEKAEKEWAYNGTYPPSAHGYYLKNKNTSGSELLLCSDTKFISQQKIPLEFLASSKHALNHGTNPNVTLDLILEDVKKCGYECKYKCSRHKCIGEFKRYYNIGENPNAPWKLIFKNVGVKSFNEISIDWLGFEFNPSIPFWMIKRKKNYLTNNVYENVFLYNDYVRGKRIKERIEKRRRFTNCNFSNWY